MNTLPQDIYDEISALLQDPAIDRPALATISRQWQTAIERHTFRNIRLKSTDLDRFQKIVQNNRRRYVTEINYLIILPAYSDDERCRFERNHVWQANNEAFTAAIYHLFHLLRSWDAYKDGYVQLCLRDVYSTTDHNFLRPSSPCYQIQDKLRVQKDKANADIVIDLWNWRYRYSYLRLLNPSELPVVPLITSFLTYPMTRNICDRVPIDIASRLPNLRLCHWRMNDWEIPYIALRQTHRHDLTQAVANVLPQVSALQSLTLSMRSIFYWAPSFSAGTLHPGNSTFDTLSDAIRTATAGITTLRELSINGIIDASLFWPGPAHALSEPYWQNLEHLRVHFSPRRPSGGYYFWDSQQTISAPSKAVPPGYGHNEAEDVTTAIYFSPRKHIPCHGQVRESVIPDNDSLVPLIEAFGRACLQIPMLRSAELSTTIPISMELDNGKCLERQSPWGVWYFSPGISLHAAAKNMHPAFSEHISQRRLFWDVKDWRPSTDLQNLLRNIGYDRYGIHLAEQFVDTWGDVRKDQELQDYQRRQSQDLF